jgi:FtsP/CotA-like multicopper oxidase with cupredoxin domain
VSDSIIIAPSERYIFEVEFNQTGIYKITNKNPENTQILGMISVKEENLTTNQSNKNLHENQNIIADVNKYRQYFNKSVDYEYSLTIDIPGSASNESLMEHHEDGIEWEDSMFAANKGSTNDMLTWIIKDSKTGKTNMAALGQVEKNQIIKIKITNDANSIHPMQHPIHLHGARFLVVKTNNITNENLVWKDTVLIPVGGSVELLTYFPNDGEWMMHCHIAEHLGSNMMTGFEVN